MGQLIVIPTLAEAQPLIRAGGFQPGDLSGFYTIPGKSVNLFIAGIGIVPVLYNLTRHFSQFRYERVIHGGIAGSFFLPLQPCEVVEVVKDTFADFGIDHGGIFRWIFHEGLWAPDERPFRDGWLEVPHLQGLQLEKVNSVTVDLVTGSPARKKQLEYQFNPQIETMEGAAVLYVCKMEDIPVTQIRAISNYVGTRDRYNWKIGEAIEALTDVLLKLL
jgi:futalosine hydrolase